MTVVLLIRHATNDYVKEGRLAGWTLGIHINGTGQREADALATRLNDIPIHAIYSSPLERAVETAQAIAFCQHLEVRIRQDLGELQTGEWTGKLIKELEGQEIWKKVQSTPSEVRVPGGESFVEMQQRLVGAIDAIVAAHPKEVVAVVSHADPLKAAIAHYLGMQLNDFQRLAVSPASVTIFMLSPEHKPFLFALNNMGTLPTFKPEPPKKENAPASALEKAPAEQASENSPAERGAPTQDNDAKEGKDDA